MSQPSGTRNVDLLAWFDENERQLCESCDHLSKVTLPRVVASFCLACGAITIDGVRLDVERLTA